MAGVVLYTEGAEADAVGASTDLLQAICEEVRVVGAPGAAASPLELLVEALSGTDAARVLVVDASEKSPGFELLLALTAFPESDVVLPGGAPASCAIYRREAALVPARLRLAAGDRDASRLLEEISASRIEGSDLAALTAGG